MSASKFPSHPMNTSAQRTSSRSSKAFTQAAAGPALMARDHGMPGSSKNNAAVWMFDEKLEMKNKENGSFNPKKMRWKLTQKRIETQKIQVFVPQKWRYSVTGRRGATSPGRCRWRAGPPHSTRGSPVGAAQNPCEAADGVAGIGHCPMTNGVVVKCYFKDLKRLVIYPLVNVYITNWKDPPFLMGIGFVYQGVLGLEQSWL